VIAGKIYGGLEKVHLLCSTAEKVLQQTLPHGLGPFGVRSVEQRDEDGRDIAEWGRVPWVRLGFMAPVLTQCSVRNSTYNGTELRSAMAKSMSGICLSTSSGSVAWKATCGG